KSTGGRAIPPEVKEAYAEAEAKLKETRTGLTSLGTDKEPTSQLTSHQVDMTRRGWTRRGWGGVLWAMGHMSGPMGPPRVRPAPEMKRTIAGALRIFDAYYRKRVQQRFASQGPGWAPRKEEPTPATREQQARALAEHEVKLKLFRQLRRAQKRYL